MNKVIICVLGKEVAMCSGQIRPDSVGDIFDDLSWLDNFNFDKIDLTAFEQTTTCSEFATLHLNTFVCQSILYEQRSVCRADEHYLIFYPDTKHFAIDVAWEGDQETLLYRTYYSNGDRDQEVVHLK